MSASICVYSYGACSTCKKALNWLSEHKLAYDLVDIVKCPPSKELINKAIEQFGDRKYLFEERTLPPP